MANDFPLPPYLKQFVREQLAAGRFQSEDDLIHTALRLLEAQAHSREAARAWLKQALDKGLESRPSEPITKAFWDRQRERIRADMASGHDE